MTRAALTLAVCPHFAPDVRAAVAGGLQRSIEVTTFPAECIGPPSPPDVLLEEKADSGGRLEVLGGACTIDVADGTGRLHCFGATGYPLVNPKVAEQFVAEGAYLLSPGWARNWLGYLEAQGFDRETARDYFHEFCTHILLLDTGTDAEAQDRVRAMGAHLDLPVRTLACGLDYLRLFLTELLAKQVIAATPPATDPSSVGSRVRAEQAITLDALGRLSGVGEDDVEEGLLDLLTLLFSPGRLRLLSLRDEGVLRLHARPPVSAEEEPAVIERMKSFPEAYGIADDGFIMRIGDHDTAAVIEAAAFAMPERTGEYAGLAVTLSGAFGLALANARGFARLERARDDLRASELRYRALMEQASDAIVLVDLRGVIAEANSAAAHLFHHPREELIGRRLADIHHPRIQARIERELAQLPRTGSTRIDAIVIGDPDGEERVVDAVFSLVEVSGRRIAQGIMRDVTDRERAAQELQTLSLSDELTGLSNRRGFLLLADQQLRTAERLGRPCLLTYADLDGLKQVNDSMGHAAGDELLRAAGNALRASIRQIDVVARLGGDEFAVLHVDAHPADEAVIRSRLQDSLRAFSPRGASYALSLTTGTAAFDPGHPSTLADLMAEADARMYEAKRRRLDRASLAGFEGPRTDADTGTDAG